MRRQGQGLLGDPVGRVGEDSGAYLAQFRRSGIGTDHDPVAPVTAHWLGDQFVQPIQYLRAHLGVAAQVSWHGVKQWLFAKIVFDQFRHVGVQALVVGDPITWRVGDNEEPIADRIEQPGAEWLPVRASGAE